MDRCTVEDIAWAKEVLADPKRTAEAVAAFNAAPSDLDAFDTVHFLTQVLNNNIEGA